MWIDNKGTLRYFGREKGHTGHAGGYTTDGALREVELHIDLTALPSGTAAVLNTDGVANGIRDRHVLLPEGAQIEAVDVVIAAGVSASTSGALFSVGTVDDDFSGNDALTSLVNAYSIMGAGTDALGEKISFVAGGPTGVGSLVGTILTKPLYITASWTGVAFTAGEVDVRIRYNMNHQPANNGPGSH